MFYERILRELAKRKIKYLIVGGVAVNLQGFFRATGDLDIFLSLDRSNLKKFIEAVKSLGLQPRIPVPLEDLQDEGKRKKWISEKGLKVFSLFNPRDPFETTDVMLLSPISFDKAYKSREKFSLGDFKINVISVKDLLVMKKHAGRDKDKMDIRELNRILEIGRARKTKTRK